MQLSDNHPARFRRMHRWRGFLWRNDVRFLLSETWPIHAWFCQRLESGQRMSKTHKDTNWPHWFTEFCPPSARMVVLIYVFCMSHIMDLCKTATEVCDVCCGPALGSNGRPSCLLYRTASIWASLLRAAMGDRWGDHAENLRIHGHTGFLPCSEYRCWILPVHSILMASQLGLNQTEWRLNMDRAARYIQVLALMEEDIESV